MSENRIKYIRIFIGIIAILTIAISSFNIARNVTQYNDLKKEEQIISKKAQQAKKDYDAYKKETEKELYSGESNNENQLVQEIATHNNSQEIMDNLSNAFFKVFFTWENSQEYQERKEKLRSIADNDLLENKDIFDSGKDTTGGDYIKALGVQSQFDGSEINLIDNQTGIAKVMYRSWYDEKSKSGEGIRYYQIDFDRENQKIKNLKLIFSE